MTPYEAAKRMYEIAKEEYETRTRIDLIEKEIEALKAEKAELAKREKDAAQHRDELLAGLSISTPRKA